jgi:glycosyltransferase involved in cell wall biosynthesis
MADLCVIILTYNEEIHLERCLTSIGNLASRIVIIDSASTDATVEIAKNFHAEVYNNKWPGSQSAQLAWAFANIQMDEQWILRLDADEYLLPQLQLEIKHTVLQNDPQLGGCYLKRRVYFMDKWIRYGGYYPTKILRLWRNGYGYWEQKEMDEHFILEKGVANTFKHDFVDENLNNLSWWIAKHNDYSTREMKDYFKAKFGNEKYNLEQSVHKGQDKRKRKYKNNFYYQLPPLIRPLGYFFIRYFLQLGFLDGKSGFVWHFMQGLWYRMLVDAKILQVNYLAKKYGVSPLEIASTYHSFKPVKKS